MKVQSFLINLATTLFFVLTLAVFAGAGHSLTDPIGIESNRVNLPRSAKFVPKQTSLTLQWMIDSKKIPQYFESVTGINQSKESLEAFKNLRDGLFALAGLDFEADLAEWIGAEVSFALFESNESQKPIEWIMTLSSIEKNAAKNFLERFWQQERLQGKDLEIEDYRGIGVISGKRNTANSNTSQLATALIEDDLLLIGSDRNTLKTSLNISQLENQNQFKDKNIIEKIENLHDGMAIITLSRKALNTFLELPIETTKTMDENAFIGTLDKNGKDLTLDAILQFQEPLSFINQAYKDDESSLIKASTGAAEGLGILYSPYQILKEGNRDPFIQWIAKLLVDKLEKAEGVATKAIVGLDQGLLMWVQEPDGLVLGTRNGNPVISDVEEVLKQDNQLKSNLKIDNQELEVWSKLITNKVNNNTTIETKLGLILSRESENNWWAESLTALQQRQEAGLEKRKRQLELLNSKETSQPWIQLALNDKQAQELFNRWAPWRLLQSIAGSSLKPVLQGLALSIAPDLALDESNLTLHASIQIG